MTAVPADDSRFLSVWWQLYGRRVVLICTVAIYIAIFGYTYADLTVPLWSYFGAGFNDYWHTDEVLEFVFLALSPALWLQIRVTRPSDLFIYLQYLLIYIPALFLANHATIGGLTEQAKTTFSLALFSGMHILILMRNTLPFLILPRIVISQRVLWGGILLSLVIALLYLWAVLGWQFQLVSFADVYSIRDEVTDILDAQGGGRLAGYAFAWSNAAFLAVLFARGLCERRSLMTVCALVGYVFLFGVWAAKSSALAPIYLTLFFILLGRSPANIPLLLCAGSSVLLCVPYLFGSDAPAELLRSGYVGVVNMRVFTIPSLLVVQYMDFFSNHPLTWGSHVTGLNQLLDYPYFYDIPRTIGLYYYAHPMTANASFWAQDGLAGFGAVGIPIMSVIAGGLFWLIDALTGHLSLRFVGTSLGFVMVNFLGGSLFTALLTGGLGVILILFWLIDFSKARPAHISNLSTTR